MQTNETIRREILQYLDNIVLMINPGLGMPVPEHYPCKKKSSEIQDDLQDYIELINKVQRHTRCSASYCLCSNKNGQQECRFGFPKEITESTYIKYDGKGQPELITKWNDPMINPHNRIQLQGWRANVDIKPILTIHATLQYIAKYTSKTEPCSEAFSSILENILSKSQEDETVTTAVQKLLLHSVAKWNISA